MKSAILLLALFAPPNNPLFGLQWALHNDGTQVVPIPIDNLHTVAQKAVAGVDLGWLDSLSSAASPVIVAVIDSGIDLNQPNLQGRIASGGFNYLPDPIQCKPQTQVMVDDLGHGTHLSGIIAANTNQGIGVAGIAPRSVQILPLKILSKRFTQFTYCKALISDYAATAIQDAVARGARVINLSLGWPAFADSPRARDAVASAIAKGVLVVAAAGNDHHDLPSFPCSYPGVVCVGSMSNNGSLSYYSNFGGRIDVLAPGDQIISTYPLSLESQSLRIQGYETLTGTSQAAPQISGIAATLIAQNPSISLNELKARIFASARPFQAAGQSLFGIPDLNKAMTLEPKPVYVPDFKSMPPINIDELTWCASGAVTIQNIWKDSGGPVALALQINGKSAGNVATPTLLSGGTISVPWRFQFSTSQDSADLNFDLLITDGNQQVSHFYFHSIAARDVQKIASLKLTDLSTSPSTSDWISFLNGHPFFNLSAVDQYGIQGRSPQYYRPLGASQSNGLTIQILDPSRSPSVLTVSVPGMSHVSEVLRIDANLDGRLDWVFIGTTITSTGSALELYFTGPDFEPLWKDQSIWQLTTDRFSNVFNQSFAKPGSWVRSGSHLTPCVLAAGQLPPRDNFDEFDLRHVVSLTHLYYLAPTGHASTGGIQTVEVRAIDNAALRASRLDLNLQNILPSVQEDLVRGAIHVLASPIQRIDIESTEDIQFKDAIGWQSFSISGQAFLSLPGRSSAVAGFFDSLQGYISWAARDGQWTETSDFQLSNPGDSISNLIGVFDRGADGKSWFLASQFEIVAYNEPVNSQITSQSLPLYRDSSFASQTFSELFAPFEVALQGKTLPAVYADATLIRDSQASFLVLDPNGRGFYKPIQYSLRIPEHCAELTPFAAHIQKPGDLTLPLVCNQGSKVVYETVQISNDPL